METAVDGDFESDELYATGRPAAFFSCIATRALQRNEISDNSTKRERRRRPNATQTHLLRQCSSITARPAAIHLSIIASRNRPMQAPTIAPELDGTHPKNHSVSPGVKCRYGNISPWARFIDESIDMSIPLLDAATRGTSATQTASKNMGVVNFMLREGGK